MAAFAGRAHCHDRLPRVRGSSPWPSRGTCERHGENPQQRGSARALAPVVKKSTAPSPPSHRVARAHSPPPGLAAHAVGRLAAVRCRRSRSAGRGAICRRLSRAAAIPPVAATATAHARSSSKAGSTSASSTMRSRPRARGRYQRVITTGGPIESWREGVVWASYAERAADYLRRAPVGIPVIALPAPAVGAGPNVPQCRRRSRVAAPRAAGARLDRSPLRGRPRAPLAPGLSHGVR